MSTFFAKLRDAVFPLAWAVPRVSLLIAGFLFAASIFGATLGLEEAIEIGYLANPELRKARAARDAAQGEFDDAKGLLFNNPSVSLETRRRNLFQPGQPDAQRNDWGGGLSQSFEIAGQQGFRREAARSGLAALEQEINETARRVRAEVETRFVQVLAFQARIETERRTLALIDRNTELARKRVEAGEDSKLDGNLAVVDAERARNQLSLLQEQLTRARMDLAALLQFPERELPPVQGELAPLASGQALEDLVAAVTFRPAVRALQLREQSARNRLDLERAARYPDLTVSVSTSREAGIDGRDKVATLGVSLPLPLFRRNAAGIGRASTELTQTQIDKEALVRDARAAVVSAWQRRESLRERGKRLAEIVQPKLEENLSLSQRAFQNGEIGLAQLLIVQRQAIDAQRDLLDAQQELRFTQIELDYAAGWDYAVPATHK